MPYYPKSQIKTNLYTNGKEYAFLINQKPYIGYYWKNSLGKFYTGKTPQDLPTQEIIPIINSPVQTDNIELAPSSNVLEYNSINNNTISYNLIPVFIQSKPTQQDYQIGEFRRYFCKKTNEIIYIEIDQKQHDLLLNKDSQILWSLYFPFNIPWQLTGDKQQVAKTNRNITLLAQQQFNLPKLNLYLKEDYLKYYLET